MIGNLNHADRRLPKTAAVLLLVGLSLALFTLDAAAGACESALLRCLEDASALIGEGSVIGGLAYAAFCFEGYAFCREYLQE
ncbi:MAG: hypothetical protein A2Y56_10715 [Candidatus Aminicenantes bacterium RBG_13_63_10]|nr:MAG: hypothetical protein A2Y56_10715 [Candidatus Aminicenantes bacterium RBG_13_63_10]